MISSIQASGISGLFFRSGLFKVFSDRGGAPLVAIGISAGVSDGGDAVHGGGATEVVVVDDGPDVVVVETAGPSRKWRAWAAYHDGRSAYFFSGD